MIDRLFERPPAIVAHRGDSANAVENTLEAFALARRREADGVELDVRRTADGVLVVHHDPAVPGFGPLVEADFEQVRRVAPFIPTLDEAIEACAPLAVNVEIKNVPDEPDWDPDRVVAGEVARLVASGGLYDRVWVSSFDADAVDRVRAVDPAVATGLLVLPGADLAAAARQAAAGGHRAVHAPRSLLGPDRAEAVVADCRELALWLVVWTVDDPNELVRLAGAGVQALITNDPGRARQVLG